MPGANDAIKQNNKLNPGERILYTKHAENAGVDFSTLSRRHRGVQVDHDTMSINLRKAIPQQEDELVQCIIELTGRQFRPAREIIKRFVAG
jgi:hypothetical protein